MAEADLTSSVCADRDKGLTYQVPAGWHVSNIDLWTNKPSTEVMLTPSRSSHEEIVPPGWAQIGVERIAASRSLESYSALIEQTFAVLDDYTRKNKAFGRRDDCGVASLTLDYSRDQYRLRRQILTIRSAPDVVVRFDGVSLHERRSEFQILFKRIAGSIRPLNGWRDVAPSLTEFNEGKVGFVPPDGPPALQALSTQLSRFVCSLVAATTDADRRPTELKVKIIRSFHARVECHVFGIYLLGLGHGTDQFLPVLRSMLNDIVGTDDLGCRWPATLDSAELCERLDFYQQRANPVLAGAALCYLIAYAGANGDHARISKEGLASLSLNDVDKAHFAAVLAMIQIDGARLRLIGHALGRLGERFITASPKAVGDIISEVDERILKCL